MKRNQIYHEDCLVGMQRMADQSVDMILCDLPYQMTGLAWDVMIPFDELWSHYERLIKVGGNIVLTGSQPFTTLLGASNLKKLRYGLVWEKHNGTNFLQVKHQPFKVHEDILVFYDDKQTIIGSCQELAPVRRYLLDERRQSGLKMREFDVLLGNTMAKNYFTESASFMFPSRQQYERLQMTGYFQKNYSALEVHLPVVKRTFNPQMTRGMSYKPKRDIRPVGQLAFGFDEENVGHLAFDTESHQRWEQRYPKSVIKVKQETGLHPTQKPVALFEWLIQSYSNPGELILDNCMGSGTTAIAALNTGRSFIGFEKDKVYYELATKRIQDRMREMEGVIQR